VNVNFIQTDNKLCIFFLSIYARCFSLEIHKRISNMKIIMMIIPRKILKLINTLIIIIIIINTSRK